MIVSFSIGFFGGLIIGFPENVTFGYSQETLELMNYSYNTQVEELQQQIDAQYLEENYYLTGPYKDNINNNKYKIYLEPKHTGFVLQEMVLICENNTLIEVLE